MISERKTSEACLREFIFVLQTLDEHIFYDTKEIIAKTNECLRL